MRGKKLLSLIILLVTVSITIYNCGSSDSNQISAPVPEGTPPADDPEMIALSWTQVSAGRFHTCSLKSDNTVACWGRDYFGESTPPSL